MERQHEARFGFETDTDTRRKWIGHLVKIMDHLITSY